MKTRLCVTAKPPATTQGGTELGTDGALDGPTVWTRSAIGETAIRGVPGLEPEHPFQQ